MLINIKKNEKQEILLVTPLAVSISPMIKISGGKLSELTFTCRLSSSILFSFPLTSLSHHMSRHNVLLYKANNEIFSPYLFASLDEEKSVDSLDIEASIEVVDVYFTCDDD